MKTVRITVTIIVTMVLLLGGIAPAFASVNSRVEPLDRNLIDQNRINKFPLTMPQLENRERNILVYLPSDYQAGNHSYPVIYVLGAQDLFVQAIGAPEDRILNESLFQFYTQAIEQEAIIVGIDSDPIHAWDEFSPWVNRNMYQWVDPYDANQVEGGEGEAFLDFLIDTVKPVIDQRYRTLNNQANTSIAGSKMGGLLSLYAGLTKPEVYSKVMAMSPDVWFAERDGAWLSNNQLLKLIDQKGVPANVSFFLDVDAGDQVTDLVVKPVVLDTHGVKISFPQAYLEGTQAVVNRLFQKGGSISGKGDGISIPTAWTNVPTTSSNTLFGEGDAFITYLPIVIKPAIPILFTSPSIATFVVSNQNSFTITTTGDPTPTITILEVPPAGVSFVDNGDGTATISGKPTTMGTFTLTIMAHNGVAQDASQTFTLKVVTSPLISSASSTTFTISSLGSFTITTTGNPTPSITILGDLPTGVSFVDNGDGTATISGTPTIIGTFTLTITADNGVAPAANQTFTLKVMAPPWITSASSTTFTISRLGSFTITTTGDPIPSITNSGGLPTGVSFVDNGDGTATISGTPTTMGTFTFTIMAHNGVAPDANQTFTLKVVGGCPTTSSCLLTFSMDMSPYLNRTRNISVYLPPNYQYGANYPVIYLMAAQYMFGAQIGVPLEDYNDWFIDETLDARYNTTGKGVIAVGIWYDNNFPYSEYSLTRNPNMDHWIRGMLPLNNPEGGGMIDFIRYKLKPEIDGRFNTLTDRANTAIGGGSRSALLALWAGLVAPETFSKVMAMSPAVWVAEGGPRIDFPAWPHWFSANGLQIWLYYNQAPTNVQYFLYIGTREVSTAENPTVYTPEGEQISWQAAYENGAFRLNYALGLEGVPRPTNLIYVRNEDDGVHFASIWRKYTDIVLNWFTF